MTIPELRTPAYDLLAKHFGKLDAEAEFGHVLVARLDGDTLTSALLVEGLAPKEADPWIDSTSPGEVILVYQDPPSPDAPLLFVTNLERVEGYRHAKALIAEGQAILREILEDDTPPT